MYVCMYEPINIPIFPRVDINNPRSINVAPLKKLFFITKKEAIEDWNLEGERNNKFSCTLDISEL